MQFESVTQYAEFGEALRYAREEKGISLNDIAQGLHIRPAFLRALEAGNITALPAPVFVRGYVKRYAQLCGLDERLLLDALVRVGNAPERRLWHFAEHFGKSTHPGRLLIIITTALGFAFIMMADYRARTFEAPLPGVLSFDRFRTQMQHPDPIACKKGSASFPPCFWQAYALPLPWWKMHYPATHLASPLFKSKS